MGRCAASLNNFKSLRVMSLMTRPALQPYGPRGAVPSMAIPSSPCWKLMRSFLVLNAAHVHDKHVLFYIQTAALRLCCVYFCHHVSEAIYNSVVSAGVQQLWALVTVDCCFQGDAYVRHCHTGHVWKRRRCFYI